MHAISLDSVRILINSFKDDKECLDDIFNALTIFEQYHQAVVRETGYHIVYLSSGNNSTDLQSQYREFDLSRTSAHNALIQQVGILNRLAKLAGLHPIYEGTISENQPYRREIANAVFEFLNQLLSFRF